MWEKLKSFLRNDTYFTVVLIILVGAGSYGLGRLSVQDSIQNRGEVSELTELSPIKTQNKTEIDSKTPVVVSKSGTKYHLLDCPGALQIKEENRVEFEDIEAAEAAGYTPAANCPDL